MWFLFIPVVYSSQYLWGIRRGVVKVPLGKNQNKLITSRQIEDIIINEKLTYETSRVIHTSNQVTTSII